MANTTADADVKPVSWPATWPTPADPGAASRLVERFAGLGRAEARLAVRPEVAALLACVGGNSPFLADLVVREATTLRGLLEKGPDAVAAAALSVLRAMPPQTSRARVTAGLRAAKRSIALTTALADIGGLWGLDQVTAALSDLAEAALSLAMAHLLRTAHDAGEIRLLHPDDPARDCGFTVLGMGKLGARELNYSSDVDLVLLYDPDSPVYNAGGGADAMGRITTRIARSLAGLMEARDQDGYVFRTDFRLRPDPAATPPAMALPAALTYYESMGQNWERAAMIKARPVAGDRAMGAAFLTEIRPFVWRRGLDFAAVADIHAMKRRIDAHRPSSVRDGPLASPRDPVARIAGHNIKLGEGGIREIEFLAQTLQLVWGGRDPGLRTPQTLVALRLLARGGHIPVPAARQLADSYRFLRRVEHRLQMVADRQTHDVPSRPDDLRRIALFLGFAGSQEFAAALLDHLTRVRARYADAFELLPELPGTAEMRGSLDFRGDDLPEETGRILTGLGFANPRAIGEAVRRWQAGHVRALRSQRSREMMDRMLPTVLTALARQPGPDQVFSRFDALLSRLPAGVQILSMFERNPGLLERVAAVLGAAPPLAEHFARHPAAIDGLIVQGDTSEDVSNPARRLRARLADAVLLEDVIEITRRAAREADFAISVATMEGRLDADAAGLRRTAVADAAMGALLRHVLADFATRHGRVRGGAMAVVALGKAGGREMMAGSDLDLMLIYDHPDDVIASNGARSMPVSQWFVRAAHAFVAAVTAPGVDGPLYEVDMRLRPSGSKGPVAVSLASFRRYHAMEAWTWERMALTRARIVTAPRALGGRIAAEIAGTLGRAGDADQTKADARAMRARLAQDLPAEGIWDVKHRTGGLMEVEFIAQTLQLVHAPAHPEVCSPTTRIALARLAQSGLLAEVDAEGLIHAEKFWRTIQGMLRITVGRSMVEELPDASAAPLLRAISALGVAAVDVAALRASMDKIGEKVRAIFVRQIGEIE